MIHTNIYTFDEQARPIDIPVNSIDDIGLLMVVLCSGDEILYVITKDNKVFPFDSDFLQRRSANFSDGMYVVTGEAMQEFLTDDHINPYTRQEIFGMAH